MVHTLMNFDVDPAVWGDKVVQVILSDDFGRKQGDGEAHVLIALHGGVQVKILHINPHEACAGGGNCAVEKAFCGRQFGCWGADCTRVLKMVTTNGEANAMGLSFLGPD